jgi:hypothetical protein
MPKANPRVTVTFNTTIPEGASRRDVKDFIIDALEGWGGQLHPDDPLFESLSVKSLVMKSRPDDVEPIAGDRPGAETGASLEAPRS